MSFQWTDDLSTGVADVDSQHQEIISRINALMEACARHPSDRAAIGAYLDFMQEFIAYHFAAEEREMTGHAYPGLASHEARHEELKREINTLCRDFREHGANVPVVLMTMRTAGEWFIDHIQKTDKAMAAYLKERTAK
jgi:hemerythrin